MVTMDVGMQGQSLQTARVEYIVSLDFTGHYFVQIESPLSLRSPAGEIELSPEEDPQERFEPVQALVGQRVTEELVSE
jgi:hypothetical protein